MQKAIGYVQAVIGRVILIGLSVQILFGLLWVSATFPVAQWFAESKGYLQAGRTLVFDEYTGILYPVLLKVTEGLEQLTGIPLDASVCLLQLLVVFGAGYSFCVQAGVKRAWVRVWGSLALLTFPMTAQSCLSVLPNALAYASILLQFACLLGIAKGGQRGRMLCGLYGYWLLESLLLPEYLWFGAVLAVSGTVIMIVHIWKEKEQYATVYRKGVRIPALLLSVAILFGTIWGILEHVPETGAWGRAEKSTEAVLFHRIAGSSLGKYYGYWPEVLKEGISQESLALVMEQAELITTELQPQMEVILGQENAKEWFGSFSAFVLKENDIQILREVGWDMVGYLFPLLTAEEVLAGRGYASLCSRNYETMRMEHPLLTTYYFSYSGTWFVLGLGLLVVSALLSVIGALGKNRQKEKKATGLKLPMAWGSLYLTAMLMVLWYVLQGAGIWDYKKVLLSGCVWMFWMVRKTDCFVSENQ